MKTETNLDIDKLDAFTRAYIECALWSSTAEHGEPLDKDYDLTDIAPETVSKMVADCAMFQSENDLSNYPSVSAGHDYWLTRNRHGAGYWENDYGTREQCKMLSDNAKADGSFTLYIGDDNLIHGS